MFSPQGAQKGKLEVQHGELFHGENVHLGTTDDRFHFPRRFLTDVYSTQCDSILLSIYTSLCYLSLAVYSFPLACYVLNRISSFKSDRPYKTMLLINATQTSLDLMRESCSPRAKARHPLLPKVIINVTEELI